MNRVNTRATAVDQRVTTVDQKIDTQIAGVNTKVTEVGRPCNADHDGCHRFRGWTLPASELRRNDQP